ncbi:MAG: efflux transporter periplasmic adaptor subunit, partial [Deltaproteobacteria bacterium]|nr:efflux transporter periplasmic adaptor subunit [Deltaproteobacteria bacterium]
KIKEGVKDQAILIPQQGVTRNPKGEPFALIVDAAGKVGIRMLILDRAMGDKWLISSGLVPGDRVIVEGLQFVRPGMSVKTVPFGANRPAPGHGGPGGSGRPDTGAQNQSQKQPDGGA